MRQIIAERLGLMILGLLVITILNYLMKHKVMPMLQQQTPTPRPAPKQTIQSSPMNNGVPFHKLSNMGLANGQRHNEERFRRKR